MLLVHALEIGGCIAVEHKVHMLREICYSLKIAEKLQQRCRFHQSIFGWLRMKIDSIHENYSNSGSYLRYEFQCEQNLDTLFGLLQFDYFPFRSFDFGSGVQLKVSNYI